MENQNPIQPNQEIPQTQTPPVEEKSKLKFSHIKLIIFGIIAAVIIAGLGGTLVLNKSTVGKITPTPTISPTPDPTADWEITDSETNVSWKKYTNTKLNYSFEIPKTWKHEMDYDNEAIILQSPDFKINENLGRAIEGSTITLRSRVTNETSIDKWFNDYWSQPHGGGKPENKTIEYIDTDTKALRYEFNYEGNQAETEFIKDGFLYSINIDFPYIEATKTWSERDLPIYNQILSTLKFTEPKISCRPRPACFDATPRCLMPETSDMCPPSITPTKSNSNGGGKACTQEAKQCSDGSWVGRTGPNCEFAKCP